MSADPQRYDGLPETVTDVFGPGATAERAYDLLTVDVPADSWIAALTTARDELGCTFFDWLSAVDEPGAGFRVCAHLAALERGRVRRLLLRTTVPHDAATLPTAVDVYAGAAWHERETYEMFGVTFTGHPHLVHLLLPENFEGHPLRKDFVLAARVAKAWPGAKEPGEPAAGAAHGGPKRRQMLPPGVPDPNEWGPLKGQLPPAPERPARGTRAAAAGDRPVRRTRTASEGSAGQIAPESATEAGAPAARPPRRTRTAAEGSASQAAPETAAPGTPEAGTPAARPPRRTRTAAEGSASQAPGAPPRRNRTASAGSASRRAEADTPVEAPAADERPTRPRSSDAPWHHARPAFDEPEPKPESASEPKPEPAEPEPRPASEPNPRPEQKAEATQDTEPEPEAEAKPEPRADAQPEPGTDAQPEPGTEAQPAPGTEAQPAPAADEPSADEPSADGTGPERTTDGEPADGTGPDDPPSPTPPPGGDSA